MDDYHQKTHLTPEQVHSIIESAREQGKTPDLSGTNLHKRMLSRFDLSEVDLSGATLFGSDLHNAHMRKANLSNANLVGAALNKAYLRRANLSGADLSGADLSGADLRGANLYGSDLRRADLYKTDLRDANLSKANLQGANLIKASLRRAKLNQANLFEANLIKADFYRANLNEANLDQADRYAAKFIKAIMPNGAIYKTRLLVIANVTIVNTLKEILAFEPDLEIVGTATDSDKGIQIATDLQPDIVVVDYYLPRNGSDLIISPSVKRLSFQEDIPFTYDEAERLLKPWRDTMIFTCREISQRVPLSKIVIIPAFSSMADDVKQLGQVGIIKNFIPKPLMKEEIVKSLRYVEQMR
ncbi:MAG: pentapeptide repeat-containing protein [Chloroflexota bacterium]